MAESQKYSQTEDSRDQILVQLCIEFLADARSRLEDIADELEKNGTAERDAKETLLAIRRQCHSLKGMGGSFGFSTITLVAHWLEDYLARVHVINSDIVRDIDTYCECLMGIISSGEDPAGRKLQQSSSPPCRHSLFEVEDIVPLNTEVMLVTPSKTIGAIVAREMVECGYKVTRFSNAWEAIRFAASTKPDLIVTAAVMDVIDGVNHARALAAMELTQGIPVALITSLDLASRDLEKLPAGLTIVRYGSNFSDDLAEMLSKFETCGMNIAATG